MKEFTPIKNNYLPVKLEDQINVILLSELQNMIFNVSKFLKIELKK